MTIASAQAFDGMESTVDAWNAHFLSKNSTTIPRGQPMAQIQSTAAKEQIMETKMDNIG